MTHEEWSKEVKKKLIDKDLTVTTFAYEIQRSPEYVWRTLSGRIITEQAVDEISEGLGVKNYLKERE